MIATVENVEHLVAAMLTVMEQESETLSTSPEDVVSAAFTLCLRTLKVAKNMECNMDELKSAVGRLMLECMKDGEGPVQ